MTDWRKWLDELENGFLEPDEIADRLETVVKGYRLLAEAVEAVGRFWEEGIAEAKQAVDRGDLTEDNMDEWFLEHFVKSGRDSEAIEKIQGALDHLRGVGRD